MIVFYGNKDTVDKCIDIDLRGTDKRKCIEYSDLSYGDKAKYDNALALISGMSLEIDSVTGISEDIYVEFNDSKEFSLTLEKKTEADFTAEQLGHLTDFLNMLTSL